jgi:2'-5' RNA ligase
MAVSLGMAVSEERVRSFVAVAVSPEAAGLIRAAQERLRAAEPGIKWVDGESFHITLKFLGEVERGRLKATWESVSEALAGVGPFTMHFRGVGAFPNLQRARVVWAGVAEGAEELGELAKRTEAACSEHEFESERRPFAAHLTLGRAREPGPSPALAEVMKELADVELGRAEVGRVLLMRSELTRGGAVYSELGRRELAADEPA